MRSCCVPQSFPRKDSSSSPSTTQSTWKNSKLNFGCTIGSATLCFADYSASLVVRRDELPHCVCDLTLTSIFSALHHNPYPVAIHQLADQLWRAELVVTLTDTDLVVHCVSNLCAEKPVWLPPVVRFPTHFPHHHSLMLCLFFFFSL